MQSLPDVFIVHCTSLKADYAALERLAVARYNKRADLLARVTPPNEVRTAHMLYIRALRGFAAYSAALIPKLQRVGNADTAPSGKVANILQKQVQIVGRAPLPRPVSRDLRQARSEFEAKGYSIDQRPLSRSAYGHALTVAWRPIGDPYAVPTASDVGAFRAKLRTRATVLFNAAKRLDAIAAPANVDDAHDHLVSALCRRAAQLQFAAKSPRLKADAMTRRALHDNLKFMDPFIDDALRDLRNAGYTQVPKPSR